MNTCNVLNRTIFCRDNLEILRGINSECIDLIYLDPPFNKKKVFTAPIGTSAEGASFKDIFTHEDVKEEWVQTIKEDRYAIYELLHAVRNIEGRTSYNFCYLAYIAIRLIECHRILKETGSIYVHCDPTMGHYLKLLLDCLFGEKNYRNEIIWLRKQGEKHNLAVKKMTSSHDTMFFYTKSEQAQYNIHYLLYDEEYIQKNYNHEDASGRYATFPCTNERGGNRPYEFRGITRAWRFSPNKMQEMWDNNLLVQPRANSPFRYKKYLSDADGIKLEDVWLDIPQVRGHESVGYPTQKPLALLERIIQASSNTGGIVLDPFCGCATTCVAAEKLDRQWIGIDISVKAYELVKARIMKEAVRPDALFDVDKEVHYTTATPIRTDDNADAKDQKYVYVISHKRFPGEYKVGIARNVRSRLNSYQTGDPNRAYKLEHALLTGHYRALERHIHATFDSRHEWVRGDLAEIIAEIGRYTADSTL